MLLLERIPWLEPGVRAVAVAADLSRLAPAIPRDRPGEVPPELLVEGVAQTAAALLVAEEQRAGRWPPGEPAPGVLAAIQQFRYLAPAPARGQIVFRVEMAKRAGRMHILRGEALAGPGPSGGETVRAAEGTLAIVLGKPGT